MLLKWSLDNVRLYAYYVVRTCPFFNRPIASLQPPNFHAASMHTLRYQPLKFESAFDYYGDMAKPSKSCFCRPCKLIMLNLQLLLC